jgi:gliding motility-associated-like protein
LFNIFFMKRALIVFDFLLLLFAFGIPMERLFGLSIVTFQRKVDVCLITNTTIHAFNLINTFPKSNRKEYSNGAISLVTDYMGPGFQGLIMPFGQDTTSVKSIKVSATGTDTINAYEIVSNTNRLQSNKTVQAVSAIVPGIIGITNCKQGYTCTYSTEEGKTHYQWTYSAGGSLVSGGGDANPVIVIKWTGLGIQWIQVSYVDDLESPTIATKVEVNVASTVTIDFIVPDTVCTGSPINIINLTQGGTTYYWNFCSGDANSNPTGVNIGNPGGLLNIPTYITLVKQGSDCFSFVSCQGVGVIRYYHGGSFKNNPISWTNLGTFGLIQFSEEGIQIKNDNGTWYGFVNSYLTGGTATIIRMNFGTSLWNIPTAIDIGPSPPFVFGHGLVITQEGSNWVGFVVGQISNNLVRINFGTSLSNIPTYTNFGTLGVLTSPYSICLIQENLQWYGLVTMGGNSLARISFGNTLFNTPTGQNLGNPGGYFNYGLGLTLLRDCESTTGYWVNYQTNGQLGKLIFPNGIAGNVIGQMLGNIGNLASPHSFSELFRQNDTLFAYITNRANGTLTRLTFPPCNDASVPSSTLSPPPPFSYNTPGTYHIHLIVDEGLPTMASLCKPVVVMDPCIANLGADQAICFGSSVILDAGPNFSSYLWSTGETTRTITVSSAGIYSVSATRWGCSTSDTVTVSLIPAPDVNLGPDETICSGQSFTFDAGSCNSCTYQWTNLSSGQTNIGTGQTYTATDEAVYMVTVTNPDSCTNSDTVQLFVDTGPNPTVTGPDSVCFNAISDYVTQAGMASYLWSVSPGGTIIAGGSNEAITVQWNQTGSQTVSLTCTDFNGCITQSPTELDVIVFPLPVAQIDGPTPVCQFSEGNTYSTQPGMNSYLWTVSAGGTVTAGGTPTSNTITVTWIDYGSQNLQVTYADLIGCSPAEPAFYQVLVNPLPTPVIMGLDSLCEDASGVSYTTQSGMAGYEWSISSGGMITSGFGSDSISVTWNTPGSQFLTLTYTSPAGCNALNPDTMSVSVYARPSPAGPVIGPILVCAPDSDKVYSVAPVFGATGYVWSMPPGVTVVEGSGSNSITVSFDSAAVSGPVSVFATNVCGDGAVSPPFEVIVNHNPIVYAGPDGLTCTGEPWTVSLATAMNYASLFWTTTGLGILTGGETLTPTYIPSANDTGTIILTLIAIGNPPCGNESRFMNLRVKPGPLITAGSDTATCENNPVMLDGSSATNFSTLLWNTTGDGLFNDPSILHPEYTPGDQDISFGQVKLILNAAPVAPCQGRSDSLMLTIVKEATVYAGIDASVCQGEQYIPQDATITNGTMLSWNTDGDGRFSNPSVQHPLFTPGPSDISRGFALLILAAGSPEPCPPVMDTMRLNLPAVPVADAGPDQYVAEGMTDTLAGNGSGGSGDFFFHWEPATLVVDPSRSDAITLPLEKDTVFILEVTDLLTGCSSRDSVRLIIEHSNPSPNEGCIVIHNVLTPNGDDFNDNWIIDCITNYPENTVEIYNRWGDLVNRFTRYDNTVNVWKGTNFNGDMMPDGTYYYVLKIKDLLNKCGWVYLRGGRQ